MQRSRQISQIFDSQRNIQTNPQQIAHAFETYYINLYTAETVQSNIQDTFMKYTKKLSDSDKEKLDTELTLADITQAINMLQEDKSPGSDGLTSEFYQHFSPILSHLSLKTYTESFQKNELPPSLNMS